MLCDDVVLLVSAGEEYVGKKDESGPPSRALDDTGDLSQDAQRLTLETPTIHNLASSSFVDPSALKQLQATAKSLPGITHAVAQPDLHPGTKFPIGAVSVSHGWIHPPLIGGDIGCGMACYRTTLRPEHLLGDKARNVAQRPRGLEGSWRTGEMREAWLNATEKSEEQMAQGPVLEGQQSQSPSAGPAFDGSLGTIGAGKPFRRSSDRGKSSRYLAFARRFRRPSRSLRLAYTCLKITPLMHLLPLRLQA